MTAISDINDPRLVKALAHPIRVRVLSLLEGRTMTPKQLAGELDLPLENVSYHVRTLAKFGLIELQRRKITGGVVEHHYRLAERPRINAETWASLPPIVQEALNGAVLQQVLELASGALAAGGFQRPESHLSRRPAVLDEEGFKAASAVITDALDRISALERESAARLGDDPHPTGAIRAVAIAMLFEAAGGEAAPHGVSPHRSGHASADGTDRTPSRHAGGP
jgi:DNA-binding transcriptional ArsR family regulator